MILERKKDQRDEWVTAERWRRQAEFWKAVETEGTENCSSGLTKNEEPC